MTSEKTPSSVLHFTDIPLTAGWISRLMTKLRDSQDPTLLARLGSWKEVGLGGLAGAIDTRTRLVHIVVQRLNNRLRSLGTELNQRSDEVEDCLESSYALKPRDENAIYELLVDFDSFLFETRSAYEVTVKFVGSFLSNMLSQSKRKPIEPYKRLNEQLAERGQDTRWVEILRANRHFFIHDNTPWLALQLHSLDPFSADVVLLKSNIIDLDNPDDYVHMKQLQEIYQGFTDSFNGIEQWLSGEVDRFCLAS